jgi:hypothetical protein
VEADALQQLHDTREKLERAEESRMAASQRETRRRLAEHARDASAFLKRIEGRAAEAAARGREAFEEDIWRMDPEELFKWDGLAELEGRLKMLADKLCGRK